MLDILNIPIGGEPFEFFQGFLLGLPAFVGIHAHGFVGGGGAESGEIFAVARIAELEFEDGILRGFESFAVDDFGRINADAEGGDVHVFAEAKAEKIIQWLAGAFGGAIEQGHV